MLSIRSDFRDRCDEIDEYHAHLLVATLDGATIEAPSAVPRGAATRQSIDDRTKKVLIASTFLLLYNLVESTVRSVLEHVYFEMEREGLTYVNAVERVRRLYVEQCARPLKEGNFRIDTLQKAFIEFGDLVIVGSALRLIHEHQSIGGNLDDERIRSLATRHGIEPPNVKGDFLTTIRLKRNNLAHGHVSFAQVGSDYSPNDISAIRDETYIFLENFLDKVEDYLLNAKYKVVP